jgi:hypothetical protein
LSTSRKDALKQDCIRDEMDTTADSDPLTPMEVLAVTNGSQRVHAPGIVAESDLSGNLESEYVFFNGNRIARKGFSWQFRLLLLLRPFEDRGLGN